MKILAVVVVLLSPMVVNADPMRFSYDGEVTLVQLGTGYSVGDIISGWFLYDSDDWRDAGGYRELENVSIISSFGNEAYAYLDDYAWECLEPLPAICGDEENGSFRDRSFQSDSLRDYDDDGNFLGTFHTSDHIEHWVGYYPNGEFPNFGYIANVGNRSYIDADGNVEILSSYGDIVHFEFDSYYFTAESVPEPGTLALFGIGLAGLGLARRRKRLT